MKVVDIFLRNPSARLGQIPGDCNNPSVRVTFARRCYLGIVLPALTKNEPTKGSLRKWLQWQKKYHNNQPHAILNEGTCKEIAEILTQ